MILNLSCRSYGIGLKLPATSAEVQEALSKLRDGLPTASIRISGVVGDVCSLHKYIQHADLESTDDLPKLNQLAAMVDRMSAQEQYILSGALDAESINGLDDVVRVASSLGQYEFIQGVTSDTLKGTASGNMMPSVLCLNDQGGRIMECSEDISGTLRAQEHGHQPLVFENHGIDARYTGPHSVVPTLSARAGTGGNNLSLVMQDEEPVFCITGNAIDRQPQNGGNGIGIQEDIAYTLTATDHHAVFTRQRSDKFQEGEVTSTQSVRQNKEATDLVYQETVGALTSSDSKGPNAQYVSQDKLIVEAPLLIRRLTPRECERLQGFPDDWTALPNAADAPRYKALGNSVAIPCVEYLMRGMAAVLRAS